MIVDKYKAQNPNVTPTNTAPMLPDDENVTLEEITDSETDPCTKYKEYEDDPYQWRSPNQKEFALMLSEMDNLTDHQYGTRTRFSGDDSHSYGNYNYKWTWHDTPGFWSEHGRINVGRNGLESGVRLRCVLIRLSRICTSCFH